MTIVDLIEYIQLAVVALALRGLVAAVGDVFWLVGWVVG